MSLKYTIAICLLAAVTLSDAFPVADSEIHGQRVDVVLSGRDIPKKDFWSQPDPYIKVFYKFDAGSSYISYGATTESNNNPNPDWPQAFTFDFAGGNAQYVKFELWDSDVQFDDHVGDVEMTLAELVALGSAASDGKVLKTFQPINKGTLIIKTRIAA